MPGGRRLRRAMNLCALAGTCVLSSAAVNAQETALQDDPWAGVEQMIVTGSGAASLLTSSNATSVTAFNASEIEAIGAGDVAGLAAFTPNLEIVTAGATSPTFFIRGIGLNDFAATATGAIPIIEDGVPKNAPAIALPRFFDLEGVSVLRGPQGAGPYRNASAGAILLASRKPSGEFGGSGKVEIGNFGRQEYELAFEAPIIPDVIAARFAGILTKTNGYGKNRCGGAPFDLPIAALTNDPAAVFCGEQVARNFRSGVQPSQPKRINAKNDWSLRGIVSFTPDLSNDFELSGLLTVRGSRRDEPSVLGQSIGTRGSFFGSDDANFYRDLNIDLQQQQLIAQLFAECAPCTQGERREAVGRANSIVGASLARNLDRGPWDGAYNRIGDTRNSTAGSTLQFDIEVDELTIEIINAYDQYDREAETDLDFSPNQVLETITEDSGWQTYSQIEVSGEEAFALDASWSAGLLYLHEELDVQVDVLSRVQLPDSQRTFTQETRSGAAYLEASWQVLENFSLDGGARYNWERKNFDFDLSIAQAPPVGDLGQGTFSAPTGFLRLTYEPTETISAFASFTRGWKPGTFTATSNPNRGIESADPESINSWEFGLRAGLFDDVFNLQASFFTYDYADYQLFKVSNDAGSPPQFVTINASDVEVYGAEVEFKVAPWELGLLDFKFGWLESSFIDYVEVQTIQTQSGVGASFNRTEIDNSGSRLLNSPRFTVNISLEQGFDLGRFGIVTWRYNGAWKDDTFFDASEGRGIPDRNTQELLPEYAIGQRAYWLHQLRLKWALPGETIEISAWVENLTNEAYKSFAFDASTVLASTINYVGAPRTYGGTVKLTY